jgi:hypothetical protein
MTMSTASARPTLKRLNDERKPGASDEKTIQKPTTMASRPICPEAPPRLNRRRAGACSVWSVMVGPTPSGETVRDGSSRPGRG